MLRLAFDFIITWRETRTRPNAYKIRVCLSYPEEKEGKNSSTEQAAMIEETEFIPIDRETTIAPIAVQALPQKERRQVITETEKTVTKAEKEKETKAKRGKKPKEKAARRDKTAGNTVLALKIIYCTTWHWRLI